MTVNPTPSPVKGFKMAMLNITSLPKHMDEICVLLATKNFDILALNETRLDHSIPDDLVNIPNYDIIRNDRNRNGGGVCIYVRNKISYCNLSHTIPDTLEAVVIEIHKPNSRPFIVYTIYRPPNSTVDIFGKIEYFISKFDCEHNEFYLLGDLNCNMLDTSSHVTKKLNLLLESYQLYQMINTPTRVTQFTSSLLDICVTSNPEHVILTDVVPLGVSDHNPIYVVRKINSNVKINSHRCIEIRNYKHFNCDKFLEELWKQPWDLIDHESDINLKWTLWKTLFLNVLDKHAPVQSKRIRSKRHIPWINKNTKNLIHERDRLKRKAMISKSEIDWNAFKALRDRVNCTIRKDKEIYYKNLIHKSNDAKDAWKTINSILGRNQSKPTTFNLKVEDKDIVMPDEVTECFNDYFSGVGSKIANSVGEGNFKYDEFMIKTTDTFHFQTIDTYTVFHMLLSISASKATGLDKIPAKILKIAAPVIAQSLTNLFNYSIQTEIFPTEWKVAKIIPLHKSGPKNIVDNYRPISILSAISKIFEKILHKQLFAYLNNNNLISKHQFGFRPMHSTADALLHSTNEWYRNMDDGMLNIAGFLDLKKAYDTVNHEILIGKLSFLGMQPCALNLITSYLGNRLQRCYVNGYLYKPHKIDYGVPQGSILGPLLFLIYINDLPNCIEKSTVRMFTDDTTLTASGLALPEIESKINHDLNNVQKWLLANKLCLNLIKTEYLLIGSKQKISKLTNDPVIQIANRLVNRVTNTKNL